MAVTGTTGLGQIESILGDEAEHLLAHRCETIPVERLTLPGPTWVDHVMPRSDRPTPVLRSLQTLFDNGRLAGTGYVSILPVDQGIEHSAGASFAPNPDYFDPLKIVELAIEGGCNAVATHPRRPRPRGARVRPPHPVRAEAQPQRVPVVPEHLRPDHLRDRSTRPASMGCVAVGATIYFGSPESNRQIVEVSAGLRRRARARAWRRSSGATCETRPSAPKDGGPDYHVAADLTGQANHLGVTIEADIIKQKLPETTAPGFPDLKFGKTDPRVYSELMTRPPDRHDALPGRQLLHGPQPAHQLGRRVGRRQRPARRRDARRS